MRYPIRLKVACGYLVTAVLLIVGIAYVYDCSMLLIDKSDIERWQQHRKTTDEFISKLFETETMASTATIGGKEALSSYHQSVDEALEAIASVDSVATDSLQHARLDSLSSMILDKQQVIGMLVNTMKNDDEMLNYYKQLDKIIKENDTITTSQQTIVQVVNAQTSSYVVNEPKKNIFKRIAKVFNPGHADTLNVSNDVSVVKTDTLTVVDNSSGRLSSAYDSINNERIESSVKRIKSINQQVARLRYASVELGLKVSQLIKMVEEEERHSQDMALEKDYQTKKKAATNTAIIAVVAIILAITFFIMTWRDVARSNRYRRELEAAKKRAEDLLEAREKLMLTITHDIKAPVGGILGHLELMDSAAGEQERDNCIKSIKDSSAHLLALVNSLLDYHRLDLEKMDVQFERFNPSELLQAICESFEPTAEKKGLELRREILESADCDCKSDTFHIRQIVENLLSNALKFTEQGFVSVKAYIISDTLYISVSDSGCGMDEDEKQLIFKEFTRLGSARGTQGVGLGLSITSKLVKLLEGNIEVFSEKGNGTTFNVSIPMAPAGSDDEEVVQIEAERYLEILVIDDDPIQLNLTGAMLRKIDQTWRVFCCNNPDDALNEIKNRKIDVVFTDIQMPEMDGFELLGLIRQAAPETPVIALTARTGMEGEGFTSILYKPYSLADIRSILSKVAPLKEIKLSALTAFAGDDPQASREILETFLEETLKNKESLEGAVAASDLEEACRIAHKMLPTFTMIDAPMLGAFRELEGRRGETIWQEEDSRRAMKLLESIEVILTELQRAIG